MPQLDPTWFISQLFWLAVTFAALYVMLARVALPPLLRVMDARAATVAANLERAEALKEEAEQARSAYERALADARLRAQSVLEDAALAIKREADRSNAETERQIESKLAELQRSLSARKSQILAQVHGESVGLVQDIVAKFTQERPDGAAVERALRQTGNA